MTHPKSTVHCCRHLSHFGSNLGLLYHPARPDLLCGCNTLTRRTARSRVGRIGQYDVPTAWNGPARQKLCNSLRREACQVVIELAALSQGSVGVLHLDHPVPVHLDPLVHAAVGRALGAAAGAAWAWIAGTFRQEIAEAIAAAAKKLRNASENRRQLTNLQLRPCMGSAPVAIAQLNMNFMCPDAGKLPVHSPKVNGMNLNSG
jgi:hypothetical protein